VLSKYFYPKKVNNLIRLGNKLDGGYIFNKKSLLKCKYCLSFGLGDNFTFESDLKKINPKIKIEVYDHTVDYKFWIKHFFYWLWKSIRFRKYLNFLNFVKYIYFFYIKENIHLKKKVGSSQNTLSKILERSKFDPLYTLLKIDIDGDEYKIINEIKNYNFFGLIIEFENLNKNFKKVEKFIYNNKNLELIHIHGNNFSSVIDHIPDSIELSFVNKNFVDVRKKNHKKYPIKNLDYPNDIMKKDIELIFKK
tara:strand:- start:175 stop:924 length:750 start_codon:yes stop_codon:yes gene_type:complete